MWVSLSTATSTKTAPHEYELIESLASEGSADPLASTGLLPLRAIRSTRLSAWEGLFLLKSLPSLASISKVFSPCKGDAASAIARSANFNFNCVVASWIAGNTEAEDCDPPDTGALGSVESPSFTSTREGSIPRPAAAC